MTGKHADWIHTDDIVNIKDRISKAERNFTKSIYMELQEQRTAPVVVGENKTEG